MQQGLDLDMPALIYPGPRSNVMDHLSATGWQGYRRSRAGIVRPCGPAAAGARRPRSTRRDHLRERHPLTTVQNRHSPTQSAVVLPPSRTAMASTSAAGRDEDSCRNMSRTDEAG